MSTTHVTWKASAGRSAGSRALDPRGLLPLLVLTLLFPGVARASAPPAADAPERAAVELLLRQWDSALAAKDLPKLLDLYEPSDSLLRAGAEQDARGWIDLDTLACTSRLRTLSAAGDTLRAVLFRRLTYREYGREQCKLNWIALGLLRDGVDWKICAENERSYLRTLGTDLHVRLAPDEGRMEGEASIRVEAVEPGEDNILLGLNRGLTVKSITIRNPATGKASEVAFERIADAIVVPRSAPLGAGESRLFRITYDGSLFNESREGGYSQVSIAPEGSFASWVTSWYPHVQGTGSKSSGRIVFDLPAGETVASSGRPDGRTIRGDREEQAFKVRKPADFSFAVGRYFHHEETVDGVAVGVYFLEGGSEKASLYLPVLARILRVERGFYGMYPFDSYSIVEIPSGAAGALGGSSEQGMNLFPVGGLPDGAIPLPLLAHEMGHSWWGNLVQSKDGPVIDEGMAQTTAVLCLREIEGEEAMRRFLYRGTESYPQSASMYFGHFAGMEGRDLPLALAASGSRDQMLLHDLADTKGHFVYNMLRESIGTEAFLQGLRSVVSRFAMKEIGLRDLEQEWEAASGQDLRQFFRQWFYRSGAPEFALRSAVVRTGEGFEVRGTVSQAGDPYAVRIEVTAVRRDTTGGAASDSAWVRTVHLVDVKGPETAFSFPVPAAPDTVVLDPAYKVLRWTDEFRSRDLLSRVRELRSAGRADSAVALLTRKAPEIPGGLAGLYQLGLCYQDRGELAAAQRCFRRAHDAGRLVGSPDPAVEWSTLHLGQVCDLTQRREEAKAWYAEVLATTEEGDARTEAQRGLASPYVPRARGKGPDRDTLDRLAGSYGTEGGLSIRITAGADSVLSAEAPGQPPSALEWVEGLRFRAVLAEGITLQFAEGTPCPGFDLDANGRVIHLKRTDGMPRGEGR